jgi:L-lysine 2,3-aminomutase
LICSAVNASVLIPPLILPTVVGSCSFFCCYCWRKSYHKQGS